VATTPFTVLEALEQQARACAHSGSPLYAALLTGLAEDHRAGGLTATMLDGISEQPVHDAVPLRYLATAHRLALARRAPALAAHYPSCGGVWVPGEGGDVLTTDFLETVGAQRAEFVAGMRRNVQTNEVGRAAVLMSGFSWITARYGLPLRSLEIGSSGGLLSRWPHYAYDTGQSSAGDSASGVRFGPEWFVPPLPTLAGTIDLVDRQASDISPIDATSDEGRLTMLSFLWPDQHERRERMLAALDIAARFPVSIERADAGEWLADRLGSELPVGVTTVVFHSIVWQYLPRPTRDAVRAALRRAGEATEASAPLCWLRMEPATSEHADLRVTSWPGGEEVLLAHVGYHGAGVRWLA